MQQQQNCLNNLERQQPQCSNSIQHSTEEPFLWLVNAVKSHSSTTMSLMAPLVKSDYELYYKPALHRRASEPNVTVAALTTKTVTKNKLCQRRNTLSSNLNSSLRGSAMQRRKKFADKKKVHFGTFEEITYLKNSAPHPRSLEEEDEIKRRRKMVKLKSARPRRLSLLRLAEALPIRRSNSATTTESESRTGDATEEKVSPPSPTPPPNSPEKPVSKDSLSISSLTKWFQHSSKR